MKKLLSAIFVASLFVANAQSQKFTYNFITQNDSASRASPVEERLALVVDKKGSMFYSEDKVKSDSIFQAKISNARLTSNFNLDIKGIKMGRFGMIVNKDYPTYKTVVSNKVGINVYEYNEDRKPKWNITQEKEKIGEWNAQKATTNYMGRDWEAWFTTDIPIQDGPYVFQGLPGLIVKVVDTNQDFTFVLEGIKNNFTIADIKKDKVIKLNYDKYKKAYQENYLNPGKDRNMLMGGSAGVSVVSVSYVVNGKEVSAQEMKRKDDEQAKKRKLTDLNPIDKDLIVK